MPLTPDWATFFSPELAALTALTGFVGPAIKSGCGVRWITVDLIVPG
jgi:hypothetical protein